MMAWDEPAAARLRRRQLLLWAGGLAALPVFDRALAAEDSASPGAAARAVPPVDWTDDPFFGAGFVDTDEWRDTQVRHRFVHGGFRDTDTRFSIWFPEPAAWRGRFAQFLQGGLGGSEFRGQQSGASLIAFENGAYFLESNQGHVGNDMKGLKGEGDVLSWRASAQSARFARRLATEMYGRPPAFGYVFGGSGGGMRSIDCIEAAPAIWQGAVPFMINRNGLTSFNWSVAAWASMVLAGKLEAIARAADAGGDGPYSVVETDEERLALDRLYAAGFPRGAEDQLGPNPLWILGMQLAFATDPAYIVAFWRQPGYAGHDREPAVERMLIETELTVKALRTGDEVGAAASAAEDLTGAVTRMSGPGTAGLVLDTERPAMDFLGASLEIVSGKAKGRRLLCTGGVGESITAFLDPVGFEGVEPGDRIAIANRALIAFLYLHRHAVDPRYPGMAAYFEAGQAIYPQRPIDFDAQVVPKGRFQGKMIHLQHTHDREAWPTSALPYIADVNAHFGQATRDNYRIWWIENAAHLPPSASQRTEYVSYQGAYAQGLRDVIAWVEEGRAPPVSTGYSLADGVQVQLADDAKDRGGIQPLVTIGVGGRTRAEARVGEAVRIEAEAVVPPGAGTLVRMAFDLDGSGAFATPVRDLEGAPIRHRAGLTHSFERPGTHMVTVMAWAQREGDARAELRLVPNLARLRVDVR
ncbi:MAG: hypothetical protein HXY25_11645 [Alphaproteobacteria bacterium]|nr:hypothetical protein [Alphaproteobacteria bacterium]